MVKALASTSWSRLQLDHNTTDPQHDTTEPPHTYWPLRTHNTTQRTHNTTQRTYNDHNDHPVPVPAFLHTTYDTTTTTNNHASLQHNFQHLTTTGAVDIVNYIRSCPPPLTKKRRAGTNNNNNNNDNNNDNTMTVTTTITPIYTTPQLVTVTCPTGPKELPTCLVCGAEGHSNHECSRHQLTCAHCNQNTNLSRDCPLQQEESFQKYLDMVEEHKLYKWPSYPTATTTPDQQNKQQHHRQPMYDPPNHQHDFGNNEGINKHYDVVKETYHNKEGKVIDKKTYHLLLAYLHDLTTGEQQQQQQQHDPQHIANHNDQNDNDQGEGVWNWVQEDDDTEEPVPTPITTNTAQPTRGRFNCCGRRRRLETTASSVQSVTTTNNDSQARQDKQHHNHHKRQYESKHHIDSLGRAYTLHYQLSTWHQPQRLNLQTYKPQINHLLIALAHKLTKCPF